MKAESRQPARVLGLAHFAQSGDGRPKTITLHLSEPLAVELGEVHSTGLPQMEACGLTHRYMRVEQPVAVLLGPSRVASPQTRKVPPCGQA